MFYEDYATAPAPTAPAPAPTAPAPTAPAPTALAPTAPAPTAPAPTAPVTATTTATASTTTPSTIDTRVVEVTGRWGIAGFSVILFLIVVWIVAGIAAFIMSLVCFGRSGTIIEKVIGLALAFFLGPFYWFFHSYSTTYCKTGFTGGRRRR
jgi:hypothetical protein